MILFQAGIIILLAMAIALRTMLWLKFERATKVQLREEIALRLMVQPYRTALMAKFGTRKVTLQNIRHCDSTGKFIENRIKITVRRKDNTAHLERSYADFKQVMKYQKQNSDYILEDIQQLITTLNEMLVARPEKKPSKKQLKAVDGGKK